MKNIDLIKKLLEFPMDSEVMVVAADLGIGGNATEQLTDVDYKKGSRTIELVAEDLVCREEAK